MVEQRFVVPLAVGSIPIVRPTQKLQAPKGAFCFCDCGAPDADEPQKGSNICTEQSEDANNSNESALGR